jgi:5-formyltetrahydrofolate cyclo-ligase
MDYYYINSFDDLEKGAYGLMEPDINKCQKVTDLNKGICLVPGLVYDREGYRLGFGKGYYDRFLINFHGITIGICYSRCVEQSLPRGFYDKPIDLVVTEKYTVDTRNM